MVFLERETIEHENNTSLKSPATLEKKSFKQSHDWKRSNPEETRNQFLETCVLQDTKGAASLCRCHTRKLLLVEAFVFYKQINNT